MYRQYDLRSDDHRLTCWLKDGHGLRPGTLVTLKGDPDERYWEVIRVSSTVLSDPPERRWQVGGLL